MGNDEDSPLTIILTSDDGISWTDVTPLDISGGLNSVIYKNEKFVAVGWGYSEELLILTSSNGTTWTNDGIELPSGVSGELLSVTYGNGKFVAVGGSSESQPLILTSSNGTTWADVTPSDISDALASSTYGNGKFVVVPIFSKFLLSSSGGEEWDPKSLSFDEVFSITGGVWFVNNTFMLSVAIIDYEEMTVIPYIFSSGDGELWEKQEFSLQPITPTVFLYDGNRYFAVGMDLFVGGVHFLTGTPKGSEQGQSSSSSIFGTRFCSAGVTTFCRPQNGFVNNNPLVNIYTELLGLYQQLLSAMQGENS